MELTLQSWQSIQIKSRKSVLLVHLLVIIEEYFTKTTSSSSQCNIHKFYQQQYILVVRIFLRLWEVLAARYAVGAPRFEYTPQVKIQGLSWGPLRTAFINSRYSYICRYYLNSHLGISYVPPKGLSNDKLPSRNIDKFLEKRNKKT